MANIKEETYSDMLRSITAFITINTETKKDSKICDKLFKLPEVKEVYCMHGEKDVLVKIVLTRDMLTSDAEVIGQFVHEKVRKLQGILSTQTLIPISAQTKD
jgi:hypothetical protein